MARSRVTGYQQGQFRIVRDKAGVDYAVPTYEGSARILTPDGRTAAPAKTVRLDVLKQSILSEARQRRPHLEN